MMEKISAVIATFNEAGNIADCIKSVEGVDEVIVNDDGSTDGTVEIALDMGAKVYRRHEHAEFSTQADVEAFHGRFGWDPAFKEGTRIRNGHLEFLEGVEHATHDWIVCPDADERVSWDLPRLKKEVLPVADQIICEFVHSHDEQGNPHRVSTITKMFRKSVTKIEGRTHGVVIPYGRIHSVGFMRVDHWQKPGHSQSYVLPIMEYCVLKEDDQRSRFYLGREYYYYREYARALTLLDLYLKDATWMPEIAQAHLYRARCLWESQRGDEARDACLKVILLNPDQKEALELMSEMYFEPWKSKWKFIASNATDKDILF